MLFSRSACGARQTAQEVARLKSAEQRGLFLNDGFALNTTGRAPQAERLK